MKEKFIRVEHDLLGKREIPADVYYGIQTQRAIENFPISGIKPHHYLIKSTVAIKKAASLTGVSLGLLNSKIGNAIAIAADEVLAGMHLNYFVVDVFQAGAGTSHNMNVNEVLANRAIEIFGGNRGDYSIVHPNDHVNWAQSSNDVFPTAMRISTIWGLSELIRELDNLYIALNNKASEFSGIIKSGRTHLQDAVPLRLGQEFSGYTKIISDAIKRIRNSSEKLYELNIGATAVGTGLNTHPEYRNIVVKNLCSITGLNLVPAKNLFEKTQSMADFVDISSSLKNLALELIKIANDLRLLSSGPMTGLGEVELPAVQPGSSIMPAKINPVMAEMLNMVCFQVVGNDLAISLASQAGQLELNVMGPVIIYNLLFSIDILKNGINSFTEMCVKGITVNKDRCRYYFERSLALATILNPYIGYEAAAEVAHQAIKEGKTIKEVILEKGILSKAKLEEILSMKNLTGD